MLLIPGIAPHIHVDHHHVGDYDHDQWWWLWSSSDIAPHIYVDHIPNIIIVLLLVPIILIFTPLTSKTACICHEWKSKAGRQYNSRPSWTKHMSSSLLLHPPTHSIGFILRRDLIKLAFTVKTCAGASNWNPTHHSWQSIFRARKQIVHRETFSSAQSRCLDFP